MDLAFLTKQNIVQDSFILMSSIAIYAPRVKYFQIKLFSKFIFIQISEL